MGGCSGATPACSGLHGCPGAGKPTKWSEVRFRRFCSNWRCLLYVTVALAGLFVGMLITVKGLQESLSDDPYVNTFLGFGGVGQMWVLGPTLMMGGTAIAIVALVMRKKAVDQEFLTQMKIQEHRNPYTHEKEEAPEEQAVPMEPIIFLL